VFPSRTATPRSFAIAAPQRREKRTRAVMKVKVSAPENPGSILHQSACTLDVAGRGARISGVKYAGAPGSTVVVERGNFRAKFIVAWIGEPGTARDGQLGLRAAEPIRGLWGIETAPANDYYSGIEAEGVARAFPPAATSGSASAPAAAPSRGLMRYSCRGEVEFKKDAQFSLAMKGKLRDIGGRGCFVMTKEKFQLNTRVALQIKIGLVDLQVRASVKTAEPLGMWMEWVDLPEAERERINELVERLAV
jgi:hypothetical protein